MSIAIVGSTADSMINFREQLIRVLVAQGENVYCYAIDFNHQSKQVILDMGATPVDFVLSRSSMNPLKLVKEAWQLSRILRRQGINTVFAFFMKPTVIAMFAGFLAGVKKRVAMLEGLGSTFTDYPGVLSKRTRFFRHVQAATISCAYILAHRVIFLNSDDERDLYSYFGKIRKSKIHILFGIGVDLDTYSYQELPSTISGFHFIFVGRLIQEKGIYEFIEAALEVHRLHPNARFTVVGDLDLGNPSSLSKEELDKLKKIDGISFLGFRSDVVDLLAAAHVLVLPSYREGFPKVVMEAMSIGRPVIACNVPGSREAVVEGVTGKLVQVGSTDELVQSMLSFIFDDKITTMSISARYYALSNFDGHKQANKLVKIAFD